MSRPSNKWYDLARYLVYILRHKPQELALELDSQGFVEIHQLLEALGKHKKYGWVNKEDIFKAVKGQKKKIRLEIVEEKIRAVYGHSREGIPPICYEPSFPPPFLFHGTSPENWESILEKGLIPLSRKFVHFSTSKEMALEVGKRHNPKEVLILKIDAQRAAKEGRSFYHPGEEVWLASYLEPRYIIKKEKVVF